MWSENAVKLATLHLPKGWNGWLRRAVNLVTAGTFEAVVRAMSTIVSDSDIALAENEILLALTKPFKPFADDRKMTSVQRIAPDQAFQRRVPIEYNGARTVCESRWSVDGKIEVEAAHIIRKKSKGSDDPRNGIALCRFHPWAFDKGLFSFTDQMEVIVSRRVHEFSKDPQAVVGLTSKKVIVPNSASARPSEVALTWHRENILLR
jgi:putative restriction endonuclease